MLGVTVVTPILFSILYERLNSLVEWLSVSILIFGTVFCWGVSSLFHCGNWKVEEEIVVQRLDHCGIFMKIACVFTSIITLVAFQAVEKAHTHVMILALFFLWCSCLYGVWHIYNRHADRMKFWVGSVMLTVPSYPIIGQYLTQTEGVLALFGLSMYGVGAVIYGKKLLDISPNVFGYHEIFHICTLIAASCAWFLVYSLCNRDALTAAIGQHVI